MFDFQGASSTPQHQNAYAHNWTDLQPIRAMKRGTQWGLVRFQAGRVINGRSIATSLIL